MASLSSGRKLRMVEVKIKSAILTDKGPIFVKLWIKEETKPLKTKVVRCSTDDGPIYNPVWSHKFVFSVLPAFVYDARSSVRFGVFRARKGIRGDRLIGAAEFKMGSFFEERPQYDDHDEFKEERLDSEVASTSLKVTKGSVPKGWLSVDVTIWKRYLSVVGKCGKRAEIAMDYDELMGNKEKGEENKRRKEKIGQSQLCMCFGRA